MVTFQICLAIIIVAELIIDRLAIRRLSANEARTAELLAKFAELFKNHALNDLNKTISNPEKPNEPESPRAIN